MEKEIEINKAEHGREFTLVGQDPHGADIEAVDNMVQSLFEHGCDDATVSFQNGVFLVDFQRTACDAIATAINDVQAAGLRVLHVEKDNGF